MFTRMTNENGQSIDIYENPSEHYTGMNFLPPPTSLLTNLHTRIQAILDLGTWFPYIKLIWKEYIRLTRIPCNKIIFFA